MATATRSSFERSTEWTMRTGDTELQTGMLIRRPGLNEELEVVRVRGGEAKVKLPTGKTSTLASKAEVEYRWPAPIEHQQKVLAELEAEADAQAAEQRAEPETADEKEWTKDLTVLDPGAIIILLGDPHEHTVLRLTDSAARIKNNVTGKIDSMTIGHKFKVLSGGVNDSDEEEKKETITKPAASKKPRKTRSDKGTKVAVAEPEPEPEPEIEEEEEKEEFTAEIEDVIDDGEEEETEPNEDSELRPDVQADIEELLDGTDQVDDDYDHDTDDEDTEDEDEPGSDYKYNNETNDDEQEEEEVTNMPTLNNPEAEWITVHDLANETGIAVPRLNKLRKSGEIGTDMYMTDPTDSRRILYHVDLIETLKGTPPIGKRGRKPGASAGAKATTPKTTSGKKPGRKPGRPAADAPAATTAANTSVAPPAARTAASTAVRVASPAPSMSGGGTFVSTIDGQLGAAIEHAEAQIIGLQNLIDNLQAQRELLKTWA